MNYRTVAGQIFLAGIESVVPHNLIVKHMALEDNYLRFDKQVFDLKSIKHIYIIGAGKASAMMGAEVEKILGERITGGHIVVKHGFSTSLKYIKVTEAGHPVPDSNGYKATSDILKFARMADANDLVICLFSGGGSALLADAPAGCTPTDMMKLSDLLVNSGACISEINAVRKHLSAVKGGQLAKIVYPAPLVNLILSDVPGDSLEVIASGPTVPDSTTFRHAIAVLSKFRLTNKVSRRILKYLEEGTLGTHDETPKPGDIIFEKTYNILAGSNKMALEAARNKAIENNINALIIDDQLQGDVSDVAEYLVASALKFKSDENEVKPVCLLFGGETTVKMTGKGKGGRNQHLALSVAGLLHDKPGITVLCSGTDGNDGPTDASGAVVDSDTIKMAVSKKIDHVKYLTKFDSYNFFKKTDGHIVTGPTMTNVMDIIVVLVQ
jgi:hydroxypyruvate reductase/glycerate 2-kinase